MCECQGNPLARVHFLFFLRRVFKAARVTRVGGLYLRARVTLKLVVALHEPSASPSQSRVMSEPQVNHESSQFLVFLFYFVPEKIDCRN